MTTRYFVISFRLVLLIDTISIYDEPLIYDSAVIYDTANGKIH